MAICAAGNGREQTAPAQPQKFSWGFGDAEPAHRPGGSSQTRGLACGAATGWTYVEESELGSVVALNVGGKVLACLSVTVSECICVRGKMPRLNRSVAAETKPQRCRRGIRVVVAVVGGVRVKGVVGAGAGGGVFFYCYQYEYGYEYKYEYKYEYCCY